MNLTAVALTDKGKVRDINEDRAWQQVFSPSEGDPLGLMIVSDGMGGHLGGEVASHWTVETIRHELADLFCSANSRDTVRLSEDDIQNAVQGVQSTRQLPAQWIEKRARDAVMHANQVVRQVAQNKPEEAADAGATLTLAVVKGNLAIIANVGDSRTYLIRGNKMKQITSDHSVVATLVASGQIKPEDVYTHPQRNIIFRSLGQKENVEVDVFQEELIEGDVLLLCSDGLWEMIREPQILKIIQSTPKLELAAKKCIAAANKAGGTDNISVVLGRLQ